MTHSVFRPGDRPLLHLGLLAATAVTTFTSFAFMFGEGLPHRFASAAIFSACLLLILGSHEMGHYVLARIHGVNASLPYFIPLPLLGVGTLGAVIRIRDRIPNRNALVDIGAAGPLAGLAVALPILVYGILHSSPTGAVHLASGWPSDASLWTAARHLIRYVVARAHGQTLPILHEPSDILLGDSLLTLGISRLAFGALPRGAILHGHPAYVAAWFGLLVTMLNLIPIGQLDGGHLTHALLGDRARILGRVTAFGMLALAVVASAGWVLWLAVTAGIIGFRHPAVVMPEAPLTSGRRFICVLSALALVLCVMPVPIMVTGG